MKIQHIFDVTGRKAVVMGAASGFGLAMATALAYVGAIVMLADRNAEGLLSASNELKDRGCAVRTVVVDIGDRAAPACGMKYLPRDVAFGKLRALVEGARILREKYAREAS